MAEVTERAGRVLADRYVLERELGRGGMATVHLGHDLRHHRQVAVKILRPELAATLGTERFLREIAIAARLAHPHILPLHDSGEADGLLYYVMPFVAGESLRDRLHREGPLPEEEAVRLAGEVAEALDYAHDQGIVHRDIKPGNILIEAGHAVVADFGIARALTSAGAQEISSAGLALGTPAYMSPEQIVADGHIDGRADIYSLGCVVYEMLAGRPPYLAPTVQAVAAMHIRGTPPSLRLARPTLPSYLEDAVETSLACDPDLRFQSAGAFAAALGGTAATRSTPRRRARLRRWLIAAAVALAAAALAGTAFLHRTRGALDPARVLVLPVRAPDPAVPGATRDDATLAIIAALNSSASLTGLEGGRAGAGGSDADRSRLARAQRAAFYLDAQLLAADSLHLLLDLHDLRNRTVTHRALSFAPGATGWSIGVRAVLELLPVLIPTGGNTELPPLQGRSPQAMAAYFRGEQAYRRAAFSEALANFRTAVGVDSGFALAALRGAMAASWSERPQEAAAMARVAVASEATLPPRLANLAYGLEHLLAGRADSAVSRFRRTLALDPQNAEAWMGLGETYHHLLPRDPGLDSLAEDAFLRLHALDPGLAPATFHLIEYTVRRGDVPAAGRLLAEFAAGGPDPIELGSARLMLGCVRGRVGAAEWRDAVRRGPAQVIAAGQLLAVGGLRQPACAEAAWRALLAYDTTAGSQRARNRFGALIGLQSVLVARGRDREARALLQSDTLFRAAYRGQLFLLDAMAGADFLVDAEAYAAGELARFRQEPSSASVLDLWFLAAWEAYRGQAALAAELADSLAARTATGRSRRDSLLVGSLAARVALARGDSAGALRRLNALVPTTDMDDLAWKPWESLGGERMLLARLLLARGEARAALDAASAFDAPATVMYLPYLPASLALRADAAARLGDDKLAQRLRRRLELLAGAGR